jgi:hypothetical protein
VPPPLAAAAVRAGAGQAPGQILTLTHEVLRAMILAKLKAVGAALLLAAAVVTGAGLAARATPAGRPADAGKAARAGGPARRPQPGDAGAKGALADFARRYALPPGVDLKRVGPPFPPSRLVYYRLNVPHRGNQPVSEAMYFRWRGGKLTWWGMQVGGRGSALRDLPRMLGDVYPQQIEGPAELLDAVIDGDFVARAGIPAARLVPALEKVLRKDCGLRVKLALRQVERKVIVARGKYRFTPVAGRRANQIEVYGKQLGDPARGGGGSGDYQEFLRWVGMFIGRQVISEATGTPKGDVSWHYNERSPSTAEERAADHDERAVLRHLAEQTGLSFREETRRVPVLFVERSE